MATEWIANPKCKWCDGRGWTMVMNGPDDCDKDPCECLHEIPLEKKDTSLAHIIKEQIIKIKLLRRP